MILVSSRVTSLETNDLRPTPALVRPNSKSPQTSFPSNGVS
ncbi:MAG: hypothetical protein BWX84_02195 [Verrucomicrobia bacterium ADurb.Bin118]|nr:MAG: hypothetical protein BWX84_02195 [Verrucomicrobia bacterium ADurb.Bin118]